MTDKIVLPSAPESEQNIFGCLLMVAVRCLLETMAAISWEDNGQEGFGKKDSGKEDKQLPAVLVVRSC